MAFFLPVSVDNYTPDFAFVKLIFRGMPVFFKWAVWFFLSWFFSVGAGFFIC